MNYEPDPLSSRLHRLINELLPIDSANVVALRALITELRITAFREGIEAAERIYGKNQNEHR